MDLPKIITELRAELDRIDQAIIAFQRLATGSGKRRGRPPKGMVVSEMPKKRGRPPGSKNKPSEETED